MDKQPQLRSGSVAVSGSRLYYDELGEGPTPVLINGAYVSCGKGHGTPQPAIHTLASSDLDDTRATTKLTTDRGWTCLDDTGRCVAKNRAFKPVLDNFGRVWTVRRALHNRRVQGRFLFHLPRDP
jgi:hypothetical protein